MRPRSRPTMNATTSLSRSFDTPAFSQMQSPCLPSLRTFGVFPSHVYEPSWCSLAGSPHRPPGRSPPIISPLTVGRIRWGLAQMKYHLRGRSPRIRAGFITWLIRFASARRKVEARFGIEREQTAARFIEKLAADNYHLKTGFLGTPWLLPALTRVGRTDWKQALRIRGVTAPVKVAAGHETSVAYSYSVTSMSQIIFLLRHVVRADRFAAWNSFGFTNASVTLRACAFSISWGRARFVSATFKTFSASRR